MFAYKAKNRPTPTHHTRSTLKASGIRVLCNLYLYPFLHLNQNPKYVCLKPAAAFFLLLVKQDPYHYLPGNTEEKQLNPKLDMPKTSVWCSAL